MTSVPMSQEKLAALLLDMHRRVLAGESPEGCIDYVQPEPPQRKLPRGAYALVRAAYRWRRSDGGVRVKLVGRRGGEPT